MTKKEKWDGRSRPTTKKYKEGYDRIFGKKIKKDEELEGYYITDKGIEDLTKKKSKSIIILVERLRKVIDIPMLTLQESRIMEHGSMM